MHVQYSLIFFKLCFWSPSMPEGKFQLHNALICSPVSVTQCLLFDAEQVSCTVGLSEIGALLFKTAAQTHTRFKYYDRANTPPLHHLAVKQVNKYHVSWL